jgi:hypothetical protein
LFWIFSSDECGSGKMPSTTGLGTHMQQFDAESQQDQQSRPRSFFLSSPPFFILDHYRNGSYNGNIHLGRERLAFFICAVFGGHPLWQQKNTSISLSL